MGKSKSQNMPELPEVETIKRGLSTKIVGKKIKDVWVNRDFANKLYPEGSKFVAFLKGKSFESVNRRGKLLYMKINDDAFLLNHLKMTGQLVFQPHHGVAVAGGHPFTNVNSLPNKFTHVVFTFSDGSKLFYNDLRKFGYFKIVNSKQLQKDLEKYGVEPFDKKFTFEFFNELLNKRPKQKIKIVLMDQKHIAGIGNIYADESCFGARIKPMRIVKTLTLNERKELFKQIKKVLTNAIKHEGTSVNTYVNSDGTSGGYSRFLKVYNRVGKKCLRCKKGIIMKEKHGGRGTSWCSVCQK